MKRRLCIGIQDLTRSWKCLLDQQGIWYEELSYNHPDLFENYSLIILNDEPHPQEINHIRAFVEKGGSVLEIADTQIYTKSNVLQRSFRRYVFNRKKQEGFQHIGSLDLNESVYLHPDGELFEGLIHIESKDKGSITFMGIDPAELLQATGYERKRFLNPEGKHPDEIVNRVSKREVSELFLSVIKELHFLQDLPFINKWHSPVKKPIFAFRVDSDFGDKESLEKIHRLAENYNLSLTWFLHVEAHENWLDFFNDWEGHEIALHGYQHGTSTLHDKTLENIGKGYHLLLSNGYNPRGFCAPYGIWNEAMEKALEEFDFSYTSEFTFHYDGLPLYHINPNLPVQIPIHPICTGSLQRQDATTEEMAQYFDTVILNKLARFEPVVMYHHPLQPGLQAVEHIFEVAGDNELHSMTFLEFAEFWKLRRNTHFEAFWKDDSVILQSEEPNRLMVQISATHTRFDLADLSNTTFSIPESPEFEYSLPYLPSETETKHIRKKDLSLMKTNMLDWKNRIRL